MIVLIVDLSLKELLIWRLEPPFSHSKLSLFDNEYLFWVCALIYNNLVTNRGLCFQTIDKFSKGVVTKVFENWYLS